MATIQAPSTVSITLPPTPPTPAPVAAPVYEFCFDSNSASTWRENFETGSAGLPAGWSAVDDVPVSSPGDWFIADTSVAPYNAGAAISRDGWAAYEASNVWGNYPGDNQLTGTYLMNDGVYDSFIAEYEAISNDNDGLSFVFG